MRTDLNISLRFNHFYYHNENYDWTTEMPYFWFLFFKIDGTNCKINDALELEGEASLYSPFESFESINNIEADRQDIIQIPLNLGRKEITLSPVPVPEFVKKTKIDNFESYVGCVAVLINEECALNDTKNKYVKRLKSLIQDELNQMIYATNDNQNNIQEQLDNLKDKIESKIVSESRKNQSFWKRFTSENIVETTIWIFSSDELTSLHQVSLAKYWGTEAIWELSGKVKVRKNNTRTEFQKKIRISTR